MALFKQDKSSRTAHEGAGIGRYLREAFLFRWNLLFFLGATAASLLTPWSDILLPLVGAAELTYLTGLVSIPRFRAAIDAKAHGESRERGRKPPVSRSVADIVGSLPDHARSRFESLHSRCLEMRSIAHEVGGRTGASGQVSEIRTPALDRLLWVFLRLLLSQDALTRFLQSTDEEAIERRLAEFRDSLERARQGGDERIVRSLEDSIAVHELRLDNYRKAEGNADFVRIELDRIEGKIQALTEMSVNRQDPDFLSSQVDSVAESMRQTEKAISELQHITGLTDELEEPPAIIESDLKGVLKHEA